MGIWAGTLSSLVDGTTSSYFILESPKSRFESKILKKLEGLFSAIKYPVRGMVFCVRTAADSQTFYNFWGSSLHSVSSPKQTRAITHCQQSREITQIRAIIYLQHQWDSGPQPL